MLNRKLFKFGEKSVIYKQEKSYFEAISISGVSSKYKSSPKCWSISRHVRSVTVIFICLSKTSEYLMTFFKCGKKKCGTHCLGKI